MFSTHNPYLIKPENYLPTDIEAITFVQAYNCFKKGIIYDNVEAFVEYLYNISKDVESLLKYLLLTIVFCGSDSDIVSCFRDNFLKLFPKAAMAEFMKPVKEQSFVDSLTLIVNKYLPYLDL